MNENEEEKSLNNISEDYLVSTKSNNPKIKNDFLETEESNSSKRNILINAGKQIFNSEKNLTIETQRYKSPISYSIICPKHKGIKREGYNLYDPYLLQVCKSAIFREKKNLPNYRDIIHKVNTKFGIKGEKYNDIDNYYNKLIVKTDKYLEKYIESLKNANNIKKERKFKIDKEQKEKE
jgi:hypothetical protein